MKSRLCMTALYYVVTLSVILFLGTQTLYLEINDG